MTRIRFDGSRGITRLSAASSRRPEEDRTLRLRTPGRHLKS